MDIGGVYINADMFSEDSKTPPNEKGIFTRIADACLILDCLFACRDLAESEPDMTLPTDTQPTISPIPASEEPASKSILPPLDRKRRGREYMRSQSSRPCLTESLTDIMVHRAVHSKTRPRRRVELIDSAVTRIDALKAELEEPNVDIYLPRVNYSP